MARWIVKNFHNDKFVAYSENFRLFGSYKWTMFNDSPVYLKMISCIKGPRNIWYLALYWNYYILDRRVGHHRDPWPQKPLGRMKAVWFTKNSHSLRFIISLLFQWVKIWNGLRSVSLADRRELNAALRCAADINKGPNTDQLINKGPNTDQTINKGPNSKLIYDHDAWSSIFQDIMIQD